MQGFFEDERGVVLAEGEGTWVLVRRDVGRTSGGSEDRKVKVGAKL